MEEGIVLDRKSFEALAVDTRVRLLKSLRERRKTLSELSEELGMSVSGVKEHLQILEQAELVQKMDEGRKWKYYQLTKKGSDVVAPKELKVWILLSMSSMALIMSVMALFYAMQPADLTGGVQMDAEPQALAAQPAGDAEKTRENSSTATSATATNSHTSAAPDNCTGNASGEPGNCSAEPSTTLAGAPADFQQDGPVAPEPSLHIPLAVAGISIVTLASCLFVLWRNRRRPAAA